MDNQLSFLHNAISYNRCCRDSSPCVCNALLYGVSDRLMRRLQSVQNSAARLVTGVPRCNHITPILQHLHWLPVRQRVLFKIALLVFQCLAGQAPSYLSDDCQPVSDSWPLRLRSSDSLTCVIRRSHNTYGDRCFATAGPRVCQLNCKVVTLLDNSSGVWKHFYLGRGTTALCDAL